jgi:3-hydroxy acid dehydrogenase/malonic semialdehyde reductase
MTEPVDRAALVSGAASGIGRAIARALASSGYRVVLLDCDAPRLADAEREIKGSHAVEIDIADHAAVDALPDSLPDGFRDIDTLINAAGRDPGGTTRFDLGDPSDWSSAIETNLLGTLRLTRALLPRMIEHNRGDIVNIGSVAGIRLVPEMAAYSTSKAGVHAFSDLLRADLRNTAIRVIEVMPGLTRTDLIRKRYRGDLRRAEEYYARFGMALDPADVARAVSYALSAPEHVVIAQQLVLPNNRW